MLTPVDPSRAVQMYVFGRNVQSEVRLPPFHGIKISLPTHKQFPKYGVYYDEDRKSFNPKEKQPLA